MNSKLPSEAERMRARLENRRVDCLSCMHWSLESYWCNKRKTRPPGTTPICSMYQFNRRPSKPIIK